MTAPFIILLAFLTFYAALELMTRVFALPVSFTRKVAHLSSALGAIIASQVLPQPTFLLIVSFFIILFAFVQRRQSLRSLHLQARTSYGILTYPVGIFLLGLVFYHQLPLLTAGLLILAVPDVAACILGEITGGSKKTVEGSAAYFLTAVLILGAVTSLEIAVILAGLLTVVEYLSLFGLDNLTVPVAYIMGVLLLQV